MGQSLVLVQAHAKVSSIQAACVRNCLNLNTGRNNAAARYIDWHITEHAVSLSHNPCTRVGPTHNRVPVVLVLTEDKERAYNEQR